MASFFRTKVAKNIGTTPVDVLETTVANRFTLIGCNLANTTDEVVIVDVTITDPDTINDGLVEPVNISWSVDELY